MRLIIIAFFILHFWGCRNPSNNFYEESNYILVKTDSSTEGLDRKLYVNKYDTAWKMLINYYYDGKLLAKGFSYRGHQEGNLKLYDSEEKLTAIDSFHNGIKISSKSFIKIDTSVPFEFIKSRKGRVQDLNLYSCGDNHNLDTLIKFCKRKKQKLKITACTSLSFLTRYRMLYFLIFLSPPSTEKKKS